MQNNNLLFARSMYPLVGKEKRLAAGNWVGMLNHSLEAPDKPNMARSLAYGWFRNPGNETSVHAIADQTEVVQTFDFDYQVWGCGNGNAYTLQTEHVGYAAWTAAQWRTKTMQQVIDNSAKHQAWYWYNRAMKQLGIDYYPEWLKLPEIQARSKSGLLTHNDARLVWGGTTHTDPGPNFPYKELRDKIHYYLDQMTNKTPIEIGKNPATYKVVKGDTLSAIAFKFDATWQTLAKINSLADPNKINIGQVIKLQDNAPAPKPPTSTSKPTSTTSKPAPVRSPHHGLAWPGPSLKFGPNDHFGNINRDRYSHGGFNANERPWIKAIQQQLIFGGFVPGVTNVNSSWADGIFDVRGDSKTGPTTEAVIRFQRKMRPHSTNLWGQVWADDWHTLFSL